MDNRPLSLILLPKEYYPLKRQRLAELYQKEFVKVGNEISWILLPENKNDKEKMIRSGKNKYILLPSRGISNFINIWMNRIKRLKKYRAGRKEIESGRIDLIVSNDGIIEGLIGLRLARKYNIPFAFYLSSLFYVNDRIGFRYNKNIKNFVKYLETFIKKPFFNYIIRRCDIFHPISRGMGEYFKEKKIVESYYPLPLCPKNDFFEIKRDPSAARADSAVQMIYMGQITEIREIELLLEIVKEIADENMEREFSLVIVGRIFNQDYRKKLEEMCRDLDIEKHVVIHDEMEFKALADILSRSSIGISVLPPILSYKLSSPTKVVEYLASGIPAVVNGEILDQKEVIEKSSGGSISGYDKVEVSRRIIHLINDPKLSKDMGALGKQWVLGNRNYRKMAADLDLEYREHLDGLTK